jgi:hypothetical protein
MYQQFVVQELVYYLSYLRYNHVFSVQLMYKWNNFLQKITIEHNIVSTFRFDTKKTQIPVHNSFPYYRYKKCVSFYMYVSENYYVLHNDFGPAVICFNEDNKVMVEEWYCSGKLQRVGKPAVIYYANPIENYMRDSSAADLGVYDFHVARASRNHKLKHIGIIAYYMHDRMHNDSGPAMIINCLCRLNKVYSEVDKNRTHLFCRAVLYIRENVCHGPSILYTNAKNTLRYQFNNGKLHGNCAVAHRQRNKMFYLEHWRNGEMLNQNACMYNACLFNVVKNKLMLFIIHDSLPNATIFNYEKFMSCAIKNTRQIITEKTYTDGFLVKYRHMGKKVKITTQMFMYKTTYFSLLQDNITHSNKTRDAKKTIVKKQPKVLKSKLNICPVKDNRIYAEYDAKGAVILETFNKPIRYKAYNNTIERHFNGQHLVEHIRSKYKDGHLTYINDQSIDRCNIKSHTITLAGTNIMHDDNNNPAYLRLSFSRNGGYYSYHTPKVKSYYYGVEQYKTRAEKNVSINNHKSQ